tara:strand:- start:560 stop:1000 length:441 start_codon:yes stop_codon:yes gene_type:complete
VRHIILLTAALLIASCNTSGNREVISTPDAPAAIGPYSQGIRVGKTLYLAGQIAIDPVTGKLVEGGIEAQTHQVLKNLGAVLKAGGFDYSHVVQVQAFVADLNDYKALNEVYATYFSESKPARAVVEAARIPRDALVEIMMVAVRQ